MLAGVAAVVGLVLARLSLGWGLSPVAIGDSMPFWIDGSLSWKTVLYTALLTLFGAAIVGILPDDKTRRLRYPARSVARGRGLSALRPTTC